MNILITGGAGFIGSHLVEVSLANRHNVVAIDNLATGSLANIGNSLASPNFTFVRGDIRDANLIQMLVKDCDVVYHLAAAVGVQLIADDPVLTIETNIGGTEVILSNANKFGKKVLLASTSEVYGKSEAVPFKETDDLVLGSTSFSRWSYACSKAIDEFLGQAYYQQYGLPVVIGRFFNTIGPRQTGTYGMVVPRFVQWALRNEPLQVYGTGRQTRCFCHVGDVVSALIELMNCPEAAGKIFNIGSNDEISIDALADKVLAGTSSKSKKKYVPYQVAYSRPIEDMMRRVPCIDLIRQTIGWRPKTSLDQTLQLIIEHERARLAEPPPPCRRRHNR